jgi:hypothetical protein
LWQKVEGITMIRLNDIQNQCLIYYQYATRRAR